MMVIDCGKRRLVSTRYGWKIEVRTTNKKTGQEQWKEDSPAWPANLAQACEMLCERELKDQPDMTIADLPKALSNASHAVRMYMQSARSSL